MLSFNTMRQANLTPLGGDRMHLKKTPKPNPPVIPSKPASPADDESVLRDVAEQLTRTMEKTRIAEYVEYLNHPGRLLWTNFLIGIARGLGSTIGLAIVLAVVLYILQKVITLNLPVLSDFTSRFIQMVMENLQYFNSRV